MKPFISLFNQVVMGISTQNKDRGLYAEEISRKGVCIFFFIKFQICLSKKYNRNI